MMNFITSLAYLAVGANNIDDCFANICATGMANYFIKQVSSLNAVDFDYGLTNSA